MTKHKRLLSLLLSLWMLLPLFAVFIIPAAAGAAEMDASYVVDDLNTMGVDITKYPGDAADDRVEILKFLEFGYKANGDYSEYGLYLYLYNPSGKEISGDRNAVQLAYGLNAGGVTSYIKYRLTVLSHSTGSGYENVFWKVKVEDAESIAPLLNKAARKYLISGVEVRRPGDANATDYDYGVGTFTFTGYHKGCQSNDYSTLRCIADKLDVVKLELHPVTYYSTKKEIGSIAKEYDEVFGVYFSVPDWVIRKYGNLDDNTLKGLESVKGTYREVTLNGVLTDSDTLLNLLQDSDIAKDTIYFRSHVKGPQGDLNYRLTANCKLYAGSLHPNGGKTVPTLLFDNVFKKATTISGVSAVEFAEWYRNAGRRALTRSALKSYTVTAKDIGTVESYVGFWKALGNLFSGKGSTETVSFDMLQRITALEAGALNASAISEKFKVTEACAEALKSFAATNTAGVTYVMHFAVRDCVSAKVTDAGTVDRNAVWDHLDEISNIGNSYYFEKTVFEDFDVLELHYRTSENKLSVVPVSASPIDVTGGIPNPGQSNPNAKPSESTATGWWDLFNSLETWIKVVAVVAVLVLLFLAFRLFSGFFGFVGRMVTAPFRLVGKGISAGVSAGRSIRDDRLERKAQKEHDEDRADLKADRKRRQKFEEEDRTEAKTDRDRRRAREDRADELNEKKTEAMFHFKQKEKRKNEKENEQ